MNGKKLAELTGAFIRGKFDVTDVVKAARMRWPVRVSPPPHPGIPHEQSIKVGRRERRNGCVLDGPTFVGDRRLGLDSGDSRSRHGHLAGRDADGERAR